MLPAPYQPLWPFSGMSEVKAWQAGHRSGGHAPWHLSADQTALSFAHGYLGFREIDQIVGRTVKGADAHIAVGYRNEETSGPAPAATVHLLRVGTDPDSPWEVVGTDDTDLSITTPAYGARAASPLNVGGKISGIDESIRLKVLRPAAAGPLGQFCCEPAGGRDAPWSAQVPYRGAAGGQVLTVAASTGGHVAEVERFAVTAVRP